ncbi:MAG: hypothetical protein GX174_07285 [Lentisphaerae bacterium]|jgi:hypothetical protein|nr:hypothetical protein [Lentisphaerota bacterium]
MADFMSWLMVCLGDNDKTGQGNVNRHSVVGGLWFVVDGLWLVVGGSYTLSPHFVPVGSIGRRQVVDPTDLCNQRLPYLA